MPSLLSRFLFAVAVLPELELDELLLELDELLDDELLDELLEDELLEDEVGFKEVGVFTVSEPPQEITAVVVKMAKTKCFMWAPEYRFGNPLIYQTKTIKTTNLKFK